MASEFSIVALVVFLAPFVPVSASHATVDALLVAANGSSSVELRDEATGASEGTFVTSMSSPRGMVVGPDGDLYVVSNAGAVNRFDGDTGAFIDTFVSGAPDGSQGATFGPDGNLYVSHRDTTSVRRYDGTTGALIDTFATGVDANDLTFGPDGNLYVVNQAGNNVLRFDGNTGGLDGNLYVSNQQGDNVVRFDASTGTHLGNFASGGGLNNAVGLGFGPSGHLYVVSNLTNSVLESNGSTGAFLATFASGISSPTKLLFTVEPGPAPGLPPVPALSAWSTVLLAGAMLVAGLRYRDALRVRAPRAAC